jgi:hypothetical protein
MEIHGMLGEKLGEIGIRDQKASPDQDLPQWKKDFISKPSVSSRNGIAWVSYSPVERKNPLFLPGALAL